MKLTSVLILLMLLLAPVGQVVYAQDAVDPATDDGSLTVPDDGAGDAVDNETSPVHIDPLVYEQIKETAQLRYQELYELIFGSTIPDETDGNSTEAEAEEIEGIPYDGPEIPEDTDPALRNMFIQAWLAMQKAQELEELNLQAAANSYLRALRQLRNAYRKYEKDHPEIAGRLAAPQADETEGEEPELPSEEEITEAQRRLIERFQERFQERLEAMHQEYNSVVASLSPDDAEKALNALTRAQQKLLRIQARLNASNIEEALDMLEEADEELDEDLSSLEDQTASHMFRVMNRLEARLQKLREKAIRKAEKGIDTHGEDDLLDQLEDSLKTLRDTLRENRGRCSDDNNCDGKPDDLPGIDKKPN